MSADPAYGGEDLVVGPWGEVRPGSVELFRPGADPDGDGCADGETEGGGDTAGGGDAAGDGVVINAQSHDRSTMIVAPGGTVNIDLGRGRGR